MVVVMVRALRSNAIPRVSFPVGRSIIPDKVAKFARTVGRNET